MYEEKATPISILEEQIEENFTCKFVKFNVERRYTHRRVLQNHPFPPAITKQLQYPKNGRFLTNLLQ